MTYSDKDELQAEPFDRLFERKKASTGSVSVEKQFFIADGAESRDYYFELDTLIKNFREKVKSDTGREPEGITVSGLENTGLNITVSPDYLQGTISGVPDVSGTLTVTLTALPQNITLEVSFELLPDPKKLWKQIPSQFDRYERADDEIASISPDKSGADGGEKSSEQGFTVIGASHRGRSHAHEGKPRDDSMGMYYDRDSGWYVTVVADGAGSAKYSRKGSEIACSTALDICRMKLTADGELASLIDRYVNTVSAEEKSEEIIRLQKSIKLKLYYILPVCALESRKKIISEARSVNSSLSGDAPEKQYSEKDYATTLLIAVAKRSRDRWFTASFSIGDGAIAVLQDDGELCLMSEGDSGDFAGQTRFITMASVYADASAIVRRIKMHVCGRPAAIMLMTDGVSDPKFASDTEMESAHAWQSLFKELKDNRIITDSDPADDEAQRLLEWLDFWSPGNHDDRTIVILH